MNQMKMEMFNNTSELSWKWFSFFGGWEDFFFISVKLQILITDGVCQFIKQSLRVGKLV